jgi:hypothetical protein
MYEKYASVLTLQNTATRVPGFVGLGAVALHGYTVQDYVSVSGCIPSIPNAYTNVSSANSCCSPHFTRESPLNSS